MSIEQVKINNQRIFDAGKQAERNDFWEVFQKGGIEMNYQYAFGYNKFTDANYFPKYDIFVMSGSTTGSYTFYMALELTDLKVSFDARLATNLQRTFYRCEKLKRIPKLIVSANTVFTNSFELCYELEELNIEGTIAKNGFNVQYSKKLNKASIESIINALSATTSGLTVTFSKTAVNNAFETVKGAADGSTSAEWIALAGDENAEGIRPNWTISLT